MAPSGQAVQASDKSFLLYPFEDERGEEATKFPLIDFVPLVDWFYSELITKYPENSAFLRGKQDGRSVIATGSLPSALPYLLGNLMRQMGFAANWAPLESVDAQRDLKPVRLRGARQAQVDAAAHRRQFSAARRLGDIGNTLYFHRL